ncbi:hypothetical protein F5Y16DRAFT_197477 [Xylariaceae sp. FL0255]|nr:hypothetical protein F5Y16DRAFT_197477 [Xylariaceae sp. FL0255]
MFFSRHPPWVNEQLGCVHDYIEKRFSEASRDVLAHDIEFREFSIDYLSNGPDNGWKQSWISQGLGFIHNLGRATSHEDQHAILKSAFSVGRLELHEALIKSCEDGSDIALSDYTEEELKALEPRRDEEDVDEGPFMAWKPTHDCMPCGVLSSFPTTYLFADVPMFCGMRHVFGNLTCSKFLKILTAAQFRLTLTTIGYMRLWNAPSKYDRSYTKITRGVIGMRVIWGHEWVDCKLHRISPCQD